MHRHAGRFCKKNFKLHVALLQNGKPAVPIVDSAVFAPPEPRYETWRSLVHPIRLRFSVRAEVERGASFSWEQDQKFVEKEIDRLFLLGCVTSERVLDIDSFRVVIHALDPFALESDIASMHREADLCERAVVDIHDFRSASVWILSEAGIKFSPTFPQTTFVWLKLHKNGTVYCPQGDARAQADQSWGLQPKGNGVHSEQLSPRGTVAAQRNPMAFETLPQSDFAFNHGTEEGGMIDDFRATKAVIRTEDKRTGLHATLGQSMGGIPVHKALALALANKRVPLMKCLTKPSTSVQEARERNRLGGFTQAELDMRRGAEEAAAAAEAAALEKQREEMFRMRMPERDRHGRRIVPSASKERDAKDAWKGDPLQINTKLLFKGATKDNFRAFLAAKKVLSARSEPQKHSISHQGEVRDNAAACALVSK